MNMHKADIKMNDNFNSTITVDDKEMKYVTALDLHMDTQSVPELTLQMMVMPEASLYSAVYIEYTPNSLQEASKMLIQEIENNPSMRSGIIFSIVSALNDYNLPFMPEDELADHILKRVIGEE